MHSKTKILSTIVSIILIIPVISGTNVRTSVIRAAPYFMPLDNQPQAIDEIIRESGIKHLILAFVLATNSGECRPVWNGEASLSVEHDIHVLQIVLEIRAAGGDVAVSFGGYNGVELGHACHTPEQLAAAYQMVIDKYGLTNIDFDIEGDDLGSPVEELRRFQAIKILRQNAAAKGRDLFVSLTLPATTVGLSELGRAEIQRAIDAGCEIDLYKIMAFDYGGPAEHQAQSVREVMEHVHQQLTVLRKDLSDSQVYASTGLILMNGHTDQATELYNQNVFREMVNYAQSKGLGRISFWALNRDRQCNKQGAWASGYCSSLSQTPYEFSKIISAFNNHQPSQPVTIKPVITEKPNVTPKPVITPNVHLTTKSNNHPHHPDKPPTSKPIHDDKYNCKTESNGFHSYNEDCHYYVHCYGGLVHLELCPPGTIYDTSIHACNYEKLVNRPECKHYY